MNYGTAIFQLHTSKYSSLTDICQYKNSKIEFALVHAIINFCTITIGITAINQHLGHQQFYYEKVVDILLIIAGRSFVAVALLTDIYAYF